MREIENFIGNMQGVKNDEDIWGLYKISEAIERDMLRYERILDAEEETDES